ncbi:MAG TPA: hypothetical protein VLX85_04995 [Stellaceae bacterium]|nr:hypothetical protein [Stellaceae bacterium]
MNFESNFAWLSLLQRRAEYARKAAAGARSAAVAHEFEALALLYDGIAGRVDTATPAEARQIAGRKDPRGELIKHLQSRAHELMMEARTATDRQRADDLKYLVGAYGAEAARLKNDNMR